MRMTFATFILLGGLSMGCTPESQPVAFDSLWDYSKPSETRVQFETLLGDGDEAYELELKTQIARTYSLERKFEESHKVLDEVEPHLSDHPRAAIRYHLERGRAFNSAGEKPPALENFLSAFELAGAEGEEYFTVDAAHMMGIAESTPEKRTEWNLKAIDLASKATDKRARGWLGALANNLGWDRFETGDYEVALELFEQSRASFEEQERELNERIARWSIAKVWRMQGRIDEALEEQLRQRAEYEALESVGGYVFEELGEIYLSKGETEIATVNFALAYEELSKDGWLMENEAERMARMKQLGDDK
jgi:tetratricopeptide (TPR) repeat protein